MSVYDDLSGTLGTCIQTAVTMQSGNFNPRFLKDAQITPTEFTHLINQMRAVKGSVDETAHSLILNRLTPKGP